MEIIAEIWTELYGCYAHTVHCLHVQNITMLGSHVLETMEPTEKKMEQVSTYFRDFLFVALRGKNLPILKN